MAEVRIREHGEQALALLNQISPGDRECKLAEVMEQFITIRNELIRATREEPSHSDELRRVNAIISSMFGMEFPSEGLQWKRLCDSRSALKELIDDLRSGDGSRDQNVGR